jgi:hypothetical protein
VRKQLAIPIWKLAFLALITEPHFESLKFVASRAYAQLSLAAKTDAAVIDSSRFGIGYGPGGGATLIVSASRFNKASVG